MRLLIVAFLLFCTHFCLSQTRLRLTHLSVGDGLSQSSVYSIMQDAYGFVWLATGDGLNRYDGHDFVAYKSKIGSNMQGGLKDRNINSALFEDHDNNLWFSSDEGVYYLQRHSGQFVVVQDKGKVISQAVIVGTDSKYTWATVAERGIYRMTAESGMCDFFPFTDTLQKSNKESAQVIKSAVVVDSGLWLADINGLLYFDKKSLVDKRIIRMTGINRVLVLSSGNLVLSRTGCIEIFDPRTRKKRTVQTGPEGIPPITWNAIAEDSVTGLLYLGETHGGRICKLNPATGESEILSFQKSVINWLYIDKSQNLWVGTDGDGLYRLDIKPPSFFCYKPAEKDESGFMVKSIYQDSSNNIWLGVYSKGILKYNRKSRQITTVLGTSDNKDAYYTGITKCASGELVMAVNNKIIWTDASGKVKRTNTIVPMTAKAFGWPVIYALVEWRPGYYLVGTNIGLYSVTDPAVLAGSPNHFFTDNGMTGWVYGFYKDEIGDIFIARRNGFVKVRMTKQGKPQLLLSGLSGLPVRHFYRSNSTPLLWIATEQGLVAYDTTSKQYHAFDEAKGIANSFIYAILPQNDSTLWVSTNYGISCAAISYLPGGQVSASFKNYSVKDGLQSNEFNTGAYFQTADGEMMFGGIAGFNWFHPADIVPNPYVPVPAIAGIYVNDTLLAADTTMYIRRLVLPYKRNTITFTLRALEYTMPEQNMFAYKLQGVDKDWVYTANDKIRYANLPPGDYRFLLRARNNESGWNNEPLQLQLIISPPFWQTWWFRFLALMLIGVLAIRLVRYYTQRKVLGKIRELEQQHALNLERMRISKDVHDDIGSGLSRISLLSEMANRKVKENLPPSNDITNISLISKELVDNMHDLIWLLNPENTTLGSLVARIREYTSDYLDGMNIAVFFNFPDNVPATELLHDVQRNILLTVKEAINNSVKHAKTTEVRLSLSVANDLLYISISDNGCGFDTPEREGRGNGLRNMKYRIESIQGACGVTSSLGAGTTIEISIPLPKLSVA